MPALLKRVACLSALVVGTMSASLALGAPIIRPHAKMHHHMGGEGQIISELEHSRALLEEADHDYDGHRAKAVGDITAAIHALKPHHESKPSEKKARPEKDPKEPQAVSDAQLKKALAELETVHHQLKESKAEHHAKASEDVGKAIAQLHTALKIN
jgi:hypothetical protein